MILYMIIGVFLLTFFKAPFIFYFLYPIPLAIILIKSRAKYQNEKINNQNYVKDNRVFTKEYRTYKSKEEYLKSKNIKNEKSPQIQEALNYFNLTEVDKIELKRKYKRLSKIHHPDKGGNIEKMAELNKYYSILK